MDIPGVGIVAVHDRGGAIVPANQGRGAYDRLDIWMGYGDKGLQRALNWGKRDIDVVVFGINNNIKEEIYLPGYDISESIANDCSSTSNNSTIDVGTFDIAQSTTNSNSSKFGFNLSIGNSGYEVTKLQKELKMLSYFRTDVTGYYGPITEHAVFKFQQSQGLVNNKESQGAGVAGPKTRDRLNEIIASREYTIRLVADATNSKNKKIIVNKKDDSKIASSY